VGDEKEEVSVDERESRSIGVEDEVLGIAIAGRTWSVVVESSALKSRGGIDKSWSAQ
jgi:hypothetical protein